MFFYNFTERDTELRSSVRELFEAFGKTVIVDKEKMIDEMIAVTSSSPAYFCIMVDAMADVAVKAGLPERTLL